MAKVYFVRHAEPNYNNRDDMTRELTAKGMADRELVTQFLSDKNVTVVLSSPYKRAVDTVAHFAVSKGMNVEIIDDFRERKVDSVWIEILQHSVKLNGLILIINCLTAKV